MSKITEKLFESVVEQWNESSENAFVTGMADGTLDPGKYSAYMLQDYYYLTDYIEILNCLYEGAEDAEIADFLKNAAAATGVEKETVHVPNMKALGITDEEIKGGKKAPDSAEYLEYMKNIAREGTIYGITALLQCSWSYAYIARTVTDRYKEKLESSPYIDWFRAYTSEGYTSANARWIAILDRAASGISADEEKKLCSIFEKCAHYEKRFWNMFI